MLVKAPQRSPEWYAGRKQFREDIIWFQSHRKELVAQYPDHWVAVYRKGVVGAAEDIEDLMTHLKANNLPIGSTYVDFAATKPKVWVI